MKYIGLNCLSRRIKIEIKEKFGDERKTKIVAAEGEIDVEDLIKEEQTVIALTHFGYIKRMPIDTYRSQKRGGKGITGIATREEDFVKEEYAICIAKDNDQLSVKVVDKFASILGRALANISCICNPEVFVIGGGVSKAGDILIDKTKQYYIENAFHATVDTKFKVATLGNDAGIFGGAKLSLEI